MKVDLNKVDLDSFMVHPHVIAGDVCFLIQPIHIGAKWTKDNLIFRSSVWNMQGEPVSLSFRKFFNWDEHPELTYTPFSLTANGGCQLLEKIDGSTLIVSSYKGELITRTRGTVDAKKLDNGYEIDYLKDKYPAAFACPDPNYSYIYEWVSPVNKIVINYGEEPDIYLTAVISHNDYSLVSQTSLDDLAYQIGVKRPRRFNFASLKEMHEAVEALKGQEGLCVYCNNGQDIRKVKSAWYLSLHRMKTELGSFERVVDFYFTIEQPNYQEFYDIICKNFDFELAEQCRGHVSRICEGMKEVKELLLSMEEKIYPLKNVSRKEAAAVIIQAYGNTNRAGMAFKLLDGKQLQTDDIKKLLYQVTKD